MLLGDVDRKSQYYAYISQALSKMYVVNLSAKMYGDVDPRNAFRGRR